MLEKISEELEVEIDKEKTKELEELIELGKNQLNQLKETFRKIEEFKNPFF